LKRRHRKEKKEFDILANANIYFNVVDLFCIRCFSFYGRLPIHKTVLYYPNPEATRKPSHKGKTYSALKSMARERGDVRF
jgi:hypothetical protein